MNHKPIIGLEVHVELKTKSKMFCSCSADYFGMQPNTHTCPVCLGLPGALPVPNKQAIDWCIKIGQSLDCRIAKFSKFDRKNYFYPDLPKGYQISQYDQPFCENGKILILSSGKDKEIKIRRVHMEEDTGKLIHGLVDRKNVSLIDYNRSGVPLVEIVTEPDFESAEEVVAYLKKLQQIVRYLNVSNADMEKGDMRLEPNISLQKINVKELPKYKVEVKNINSFKFVEKSINYEIKRQLEILKKNDTPIQETRGWDENRQKTVSQRIKEEANDYRYFPEPDIPPITFKEDYLNKLKSELPEFASDKAKRFVKEYAILKYDAEILTREKETADYFEETISVGKYHNLTPKQIANEIINKRINIQNISPAELIKQIVSKSQYAQVNDDELEVVVKKVLSEHKNAVSDYKNGKIEVIGFLIGMARRALGKTVDPGQIKSKLEEELKK